MPLEGHKLYSNHRFTPSISLPSIRNVDEIKFPAQQDVRAPWVQSAH